MFYIQAKKKTKNPKKKFCNKAKPTTIPIDYRGQGFSKKKKKKRINASFPKGLNQKSLKAL